MKCCKNCKNGICRKSCCGKTNLVRAKSRSGGAIDAYVSADGRAISVRPFPVCGRSVVECSDADLGWLGPHGSCRP